MTSTTASRDTIDIRALRKTWAAFDRVAHLRLIEMRGLKQGDLAQIVPQSNLSAILAGKRKISATLARKLAKYFNVSPAVFVPV